MKKTWRIRGLLIAALLTASMQACSLTGGPVTGVVVDKETNQPIAGVIVVARWNGNWTRIFGESSSACYHVETTRTDASGRYGIPFWTRAPQIEDFRFSSAGHDISLFKPGYVDVSGGDSGTSPMQRFVGSNEEYFEKVLTPRRWLCDWLGESKSHLYRVFKAAAADANARAVTLNQIGMAQGLEIFAQESLTDMSKPTVLQRGVRLNVDPKDSLKVEE